MDLFLAICQALGLGLAVGIGGPLTWLFIAVMAALGAGFDPEGTDYEFVGAAWFIGFLVLINLLDLVQRRRGVEQRRLPMAAAAAVYGAIFGAVALAAEGESAALGFVLGALAAGPASLLAGDVLAGAQRRAAASSDAATETTLALLFAAAGIVTAVLALFLPPAALLAAIALVVLARGRRRRAGEKYEGLRVLR